MFELIQRHNKIIQILLFVLIVPSFVLVGIEGYSRLGDTGGTVASMAGNVKISQAEFDAAHKKAIDRFKESNPEVELQLLDGPAFKQSTLNALVMEKVQSLAAKDAHLVVSDAALVKALRTDPNIAALVGPDGKLDPERYKALVASVGATPAQYEAGVRAQMASAQVFEPLLAGQINAKSAITRVTHAFFQKREVQALFFKPSDYTNQIHVTDDEVAAYYKTHSGLFQIPETVNVSYVVLDQAALQRGLVITETQQKEFYQNNATALSQVGPEERRASHILIAVGPSASKTERDAALAKAQALQAKVAKAPATFAQVAKASSQDDGSAPSGGDLGFFSRGMMTKAFEDAAFSLQVGQISGVVESEFGYHIIRLQEVKTPKVKSFDELKPDIDKALRQQLAQQKYAEIAEQFSNMVYEQADGLKAVADKFQLELQTASGVTRSGAIGGGVVAHPKFLNALFSADSISKQRNTEAIDVGSNRLVSGRVTQHTPAQTAALPEVKDKARQLLVASRAEELAKKEGDKKRQEAQAANAASTLPVATVVARNNPGNLPTQVLNAALSADPSKLPVVIGVDLGSAGYAVVRINKVLADTSIDVNQEKLGQQVAQAWTQSEVMAYYALLKARYKVEVKPLPSAAKGEDGSMSR